MENRFQTRVSKIEDFSTAKPVFTEADLTANGKPTGLFVYYQDGGLYIVAAATLARLLRKSGFTVDNRLV
ncbi:MAG: hypothetical protein ABFD92_21060 [Planctomycetaceae bacterium]